MELYEEHLYITDTIQHRRVDQLRSMNYRPEYERVHAVPSNNQNHAYLPAEVRCLDTPYRPEIDVVEHYVTVYVCSCDDFWFNRSMGIDSGEITPDEMGVCKHCIAAFDVSPE